MGADFFFAQCADFSDVATLDELKAIIDSGVIDEAIANELLFHLECEIDNVAAECDRGDDDRLVEDIEDLDERLGLGRMVVARALELVCFVEWNRECSRWGGWIRTGGMSHGEEPTESYSPVTLLAFVGSALLEAVGKPHPAPEMQALALVARMARSNGEREGLSRDLQRLMFVEAAENITRSPRWQGVRA